MAEMGLVLEQIKDISCGVVRDCSEQTDQQRRWPQEAFDQLKAAGLTGLMAPLDCGGLGGGGYDLALACEALGRECSSTAICFGMHCVATAVIAANASEHQKEHFLRPIAAGQHVTTLSLSEPGTGVFFFFPQTQISCNQECYLVSGEKHFVTNGQYADSYVVSGRTGDNPDQDQEFSCVVLEADSPGIQFTGVWEGIGMRGNSSISMTLAQVAVDPGNLLGRRGDQIWYVFEVLTPYFLLAMAGTYLGLAGRALDEAITHVKTRTHQHNGTRLADSLVIQHRIGQLWGRLNQTRASVMAAAREHDAQSAGSLLPLLATKANVAECSVDIVNQVMTLCGGIGYREGRVLERLLRDVRACDVMAPSTDLLRIWTGRLLLDCPLLAD